MFLRNRAHCLGLLTLLVLHSCSAYSLVSSVVAEEESIEIPEQHEGLFYGSLYFIHPEKISIVVKPRPDNQLNRLPNTVHRFYLDKYTRYFVDSERASAEDLVPGDKVAVRYWAEGRLAVADKVYVVFGEFDPRDYRRKIRRGRGIKRRKKKKEGPVAPGTVQETPDAEF